jgi:N-acetylmuramoyl-L-alanine amidase
MREARRFTKAAVFASLLLAAWFAAWPVRAENAPAAGGSTPVAVAARVLDSDGLAKLTFDLSSPVEGRAFAMADPDRIVVDVPEVNFQIDPDVGRNANGKPLGAIIKSFRFGRFAAGKSRIVIDLNGPARMERVVTTLIAKGGEAARLQIELRRCEPAVFQQSVQEAQQPPAPNETASSPSAEAAPTSGPPVIVLDPGHGGIDGGAYGPKGVIEKAIVFVFAQELEQKLRASGRYKVVMTRDGDEFVSLGDRVKIAREANAALLISIHADTLHESTDVSGATVYTLADRASDAEAARIAEHENAADQDAGVQSAPDDAGVADILFDLKRRETRVYAHMFSRGIVGEWAAAARLNHNPERSAGFVVLKAPDFPSVLLELGYLSNPQDVKALTSAEWRGKATTALATAIDHFFAAQTGAEPKAQASAGAPVTPAPPPPGEDKSAH